MVICVKDLFNSSVKEQAGWENCFKGQETLIHTHHHVYAHEHLVGTKNARVNVQVEYKTS